MLWLPTSETALRKPGDNAKELLWVSLFSLVWLVMNKGHAFAIRDRFFLAKAVPLRPCGVLVLAAASSTNVKTAWNAATHVGTCRLARCILNCVNDATQILQKQPYKNRINNTRCQRTCCEKKYIQHKEGRKKDLGKVGKRQLCNRPKQKKTVGKWIGANRKHLCERS